MIKKMVIIGRGTAGAFTAIQFNKNLPEDWIIEWHYDPSIPPQVVGEGLNLAPPHCLFRNLDFHHNDLHHIDGTFKTGIEKKNWGGVDFFHPFNPTSVAWHINAVKLQDYIFNKLKENSNRIKFVESNTDYKKVDADYTVVCAGRPTEENLKQDFVIADAIPVNAVHVTQCFWDYPRFQYSLTNAHEGGWYFGIPLQNRCAIGMLYNTNFNTLDQIKENSKTIIKENNLVPSEKTNSFEFKNYYRKQNFYENMHFNGNASFFLEPLEATTIAQMVITNQMFLQKIHGLEMQYTRNGRKFDGSVENLNIIFSEMLVQTYGMILLHYFAGSKFKNAFWEQAEKKAADQLKNIYNTDENIRVMIDHTILFSYDEFKNSPKKVNSFNQNRVSSAGSWSLESWFVNVNGLQAREKLRKLLHDY